MLTSYKGKHLYFSLNMCTYFFLSCRCNCILQCPLWTRHWSHPPRWCCLHRNREPSCELFLWSKYHRLLPLWRCWCTLQEPWV